MSGHIVLLGDSIFDNAVCVPSGPSVIEHVRRVLPRDWQATLLAIDGATLSSVELPGSFEVAKFTTPTDSGQKVAFARLLYSLFDPSDGMLIWLDNWSAWPSSTHMPLFGRFRQAVGEDRPLIDTPGHLVAQDESDDAISLITIALLFVWDSHVFCSSGRDVAFISHDEHGWFASRDRSAYDTAEGQIGNFLATPTDVRD